MPVPRPRTSISQLGARATLESGSVSRHGLRYVIGVYNLFDWVNEVPVADTYAAHDAANGRAFVADLELTVP